MPYDESKLGQIFGGQGGSAAPPTTGLRFDESKLEQALSKAAPPPSWSDQIQPGPVSDAADPISSHAEFMRMLDANAPSETPYDPTRNPQDVRLPVGPRTTTWAEEVSNALARGGLRVGASIPGSAATAIEIAAYAQNPGAFGGASLYGQPTLFAEPIERQWNRAEQAIEQAGPLIDKLRGTAKLLYDEAGMGSLAPQKEGVWGYIANTTFETLPLMAVAVASNMAVPGGGFLAGAMTEGESAYQEALRGGASEEQAQLERLIVGTINGAIERLQADKITGPGVTRESLRAISRAARERAMGKLGREVGRVTIGQVGKAASEGLEEALQETVQIGAATLHGDKIELGEDLSRIGQATVGGLTAGGILSGGSSLAQLATEKEGPTGVRREPIAPEQLRRDYEQAVERTAPPISEVLRNPPRTETTGTSQEYVPPISDVLKGQANAQAAVQSPETMSTAPRSAQPNAAVPAEGAAPVAATTEALASQVTEEVQQGKPNVEGQVTEKGKVGPDDIQSRKGQDIKNAFATAKGAVSDSFARDALMRLSAGKQLLFPESPLERAITDAWRRGQIKSKADVAAVMSQFYAQTKPTGESQPSQYLQQTSSAQSAKGSTNEKAQTAISTEARLGQPGTPGTPVPVSAETGQLRTGVREPSAPIPAGPASTTTAASQAPEGVPAPGRPGEGVPGAEPGASRQGGSPEAGKVAVPRAVKTTPPRGMRPGFAGFGRPQGPQQPRNWKPVQEKLEGVYQQSINRFQSLESLDAEAKKLGLKVPPGERPGLLSRTYLSVVNKATSMLETDTFHVKPDGDIEITGEGLKPILDDYDKAARSIEPNSKQREQDLDDYGNAQRLIQDLQRPAYEGAKRNIASPDQVKDAKGTMARLQAKYRSKPSVLDEITKRKIAYRHRILHLLVDSGNLSQERYDQIVAANPHFTPFDRVLEEVGGSSAPGGKGPFTKARSPIYRIQGSEKEIANTTESDIKNTYRIVEAAGRNAVARAVARLGKALPEKITPVRVKMIPIRVSPEEIDTVRREFRQQTRTIVDEVRQTKTTGGGQTEAASGPMAKLETVVREALMQRGMTEGEAGNYIRKLKQSAAKPMAGKTEPVTIEKQVSRIIRQSERIITETLPVDTTIFRPSQFAPKGRVIEYYDNGKRRYIEVTQNLYDAMTGMTEESLSLVAKALSIPAHTLRVGATITPEFMLRNPIRDQWTALANTQVGYLPFVDPVLAIVDILGKKDIYEQWKRAGGSYAGFVELSRPALKKAAKELRRSPSRAVLRKMNILHSAEDLSMLFEQATRLGVYKRAKLQGQSDIEAGFASREATVDFPRRGSKMKTVNAVVPFFNAGIQGIDRTARAARRDPVGFTIKAIATITIPSLLLYLLNRREEDYFELPRWRRDLFWCFKINGVWWQIPKPFILGQIFGSVPERFMEYLDRRDAKAFDELGRSLIDAASPVSGDQASGLLPTAIKPLIENETNWNFFLQRNIVPEGRTDLVPAAQYGRYTSETAKVLGKWFNYSPAKIDNLVTGYFGGSGRYGLQAMDMLVNQIRRAEGRAVAGKRPAELADYPLLRGFVARDPVGSQAQSIQDFYEHVSRVGSLYTTYRRYLNEGDTAEANDLLAKHPELFLGPQANRARTKVTSYVSQIDALMRDTQLSDAEKRGVVRSLERERLAAAQAYLKQAGGEQDLPDTILRLIAANTYVSDGRDAQQRFHSAGSAHRNEEAFVSALSAEWQKRTGRALGRGEIIRMQDVIKREDRNGRQ